jgi:hypothetical protein
MMALVEFVDWSHVGVAPAIVTPAGGAFARPSVRDAALEYRTGVAHARSAPPTRS